MELILINDTKLKIMLTEEDMVHYDLDCTCANYDNTETRRAFWNILDEAKHRTGFDAASDRVFIQLYPSKEGGCEMYVTKVGLLCTSQDQNQKPRLHATLHQNKAKTLIFGFDTLRHMISACRLIGNAFTAFSHAWIDEAGICYLFLDSDSDEDTNLNRICGVINEFGYTIQANNISEYIKEHGKILFENYAVEKLSVF